MFWALGYCLGARTVCGSCYQWDCVDGCDCGLWNHVKVNVNVVIRYVEVGDSVSGGSWDMRGDRLWLVFVFGGDYLFNI